MGEGPNGTAEAPLQPRSISRSRSRSWSLVSHTTGAAQRSTAIDEENDDEFLSRLDEKLDKLQSKSQQVRLTFKKVCKWVEPPPDPSNTHLNRLKARVKSLRGGDTVQSSSDNEKDGPAGVTSFLSIMEAEAGLIAKNSTGPLSSPPADSQVPPGSVIQQAPPSSVKGSRQILFDVSGAVLPGEICALMGPSGSGKTTLLNVLGGRALANCTGDVLLNGEPWRKGFKRIVGYVMQSDVFYMHLSVRDQLRYTALLRLPRETPHAEKLETVDRLIEILSLEKCASTPLMMVSGGEKKRVNIGTELLTDPAVMLLDEPTSGLDSTGAFALIRVLQTLAKLGKTVVSSIHQPSSQVFYMFDKLLFLADGHMIYAGAPEGCVDYMKGLGYHCPPGYNPSDFVMDLASANPTRDWTDTLARASLQGRRNLDRAVGLPKHRLFETFNNQAHLDAVLEEERRTDVQFSGTEQPDNRPLWHEQFQVLYRRCTSNTRSALFTPLNFGQSVALGLLVGWIYNGLDDHERHLRDRSGLLFFNIAYWSWTAIFSALFSFPIERAIIQKERASGSYNLSAFFMAKTVSEAPVQLILPLLYMIVAYWLAGLNPGAASFFGTTFVVLLGAIAGESAGLCIGCCVVSPKEAQVFATLMTLVMFLAAGFFVSHMPVSIQWVRYLSPFFYSLNAAVKFEFTMGPHGDGVVCDGSGLLEQCVAQGGSGTVPKADVLDYLGQYGSIGFNIGLIIALSVVFRFGAYYGLRYLHRDPGMGRK